MTKRGGTLRTYHPRRVTQSTLLARQQQAMDKANASIRRAARQSQANFKPAKTKVQKRRTSSKSGDGGALLLVLMYLLTKKWFWITMLLVVLYGWFFCVRMLNPDSI